MDNGALNSGRNSLYSAAGSQNGDAQTGPLKGLARHTIGLLLLLCVVCMWTLGNFLGSSMFADDSYPKPFFVTYASTSMFTFMLVPRFVKSVVDICRSGTFRSTARSIFSKQTARALMGRESRLGESQQLERESLLKPGNTTDGVLPTTAVVNAADTALELQEQDEYLPLAPTIRLSFTFCIVWFVANYFVMASLQYTSVASATILTATSSIWTLLIGALTGIELFTWRKLCGVLASLAGIILISGIDLGSGVADDDLTGPIHENGERSLGFNANLKFKALFTAGGFLSTRALNEFPDKTARELALGDAMAILSAVLYGIYTITLKRTTLKAYPRQLHMPTFFGFVGVINIFLLLPLFPILHYTGIEPFALPPTSTIWLILIGNSISSLLSDVLWAYAMVFTSPLVVTVGLSLNIPLSLVGEMFIQSRYEGWMYWIGAATVVGGFVFVEREEVKEEKVIAEQMEASALLGMGRSVGSLTTARDEDGARARGKQRATDDLEGLVLDGTYIDGGGLAGPSSSRADRHS